ncbi:chromatin assembly complex 1 subunit B/CAC2 [Moesziomyces antarcticus T-34]|uniref:Chromatin assembly complex 1 subunit B/CAC2 n=1 Tax=Pseudozyma antarctica (strain T-34) TaxID=1151754 RepID=M9LZ14_PSEA3|nr:chromatin assembly complex 1 subunit B/CAC2 [Moesziomyces antarcticus T-34]
MVRSVTFEIRWHDTQPIYSCSFQPIPANHLRRVLDHNMGQAAGMAPGKGLSELDSSAAAAMTSTSSSHASASTSAASSSKLAHPPVMAGGQSWRLATAGGDNNARIWMVHPNIPSPAAIASAAAVSGSTVVAPHPPRVEYLATLQRHSGVVNVVRFCPKGELLATAGDDGNVLFWVPSDRSKPSFGDVSTNLEGETQFEKEFWRVKLMCRATQQELYDMAWSPNGETLAVGGTDFVARIINVQDGHVIREISEHNHYVQGIAWDPLNEFIATQSSDRSVHVHNLQTRRHGDHAHGHATGTDGVASSQLVSKNAKLDLHRRNGSSGGLAGKQKTVSLRTEAAMAGSPPPSGVSGAGKGSPPVSRQDARSPPRGSSVIGLPYRMVYAVATQDSVWIYDTQQTGPICCFSNMHYASFTDLSWSPDGQTLMMSSTDGYCSVVVFDYAELGVPYAFAAQPALKAPAPGVPAPAHIAEGKTTGSAPSTPKMTSPAQLVSMPVQAAGSAAEAYASAIGGTATATTSAPAVASGAGLGLAIPSAAGADTGADEAPKKKRRIALTFERPLGS